MAWGSTVTGVDEGDGWLRVATQHGALFPPFSINGRQVLCEDEVKATR